MNSGEPLRKPNALVRKILEKAAGHHAAGRLSEACRHYARCLDLEPGHAAAHYNLGLIATRLGDHPGAVLHHTAALRAASDQPSRWVALAGALLACDRVPEARAILEHFRTHGFAAEIVHEQGRPLVAMLHANACLLYDAGRLDEAERLLDVLILIDDSHAEAVHVAGLIALRTGRPALAVDLFTIAVYRDGTNAGYFADLGAAFRDSDNLIGATSAYEKALELDPDRHDARSLLADLYREQGRLQDAVACSR